MQSDLYQYYLFLTTSAWGVGVPGIRISEFFTFPLKNELIEKTGNKNINIEYCDLAIISEVKSLTKKMIGQKKNIDVLINNAGALFNERQITSEGIEQSFALLLLSPFIFTERLIPIFSLNCRVINSRSLKSR